LPTLPQNAKPYAISRAGHRVSVFAMARKRDDKDDGQRLLTVDQLADLWQVSPRTIRRMIKNGQIPVIRIGRAVRIHPKTGAR
jgi:excisionase family DNA binding protein